MMREITIQLLQFNDLNDWSQKRLKNPTWMKWPLNFFEDERLIGLTATDILILIYLCVLSVKILAQRRETDGRTTGERRENDGRLTDQLIPVNITRVGQRCTVKRISVMSSILKLEQKQILRILPSEKSAVVTADCDHRIRALEKNKRREERKHTKEKTLPRSKGPLENVFDDHFERAYKEYPRKEGKTVGMLECRKQIKTIEDVEKLIIAIRKYSDICRSQNLETRYIKLFATFMRHGKWRDYLDSEVGTSTISHVSEAEMALRRFEEINNQEKKNERP